MGIRENTKNLINDSIVKDIRDAVNELAYGTVVITVRNSRITQIETSQKQSFTDVWKVEGGGGI